jgi:hypothetical protein
MVPCNQSSATEAHRTLALLLDDRAPFGLVDVFKHQMLSPTTDRGRHP